MEWSMSIYQVSGDSVHRIDAGVQVQYDSQVAGQEAMLARLNQLALKPDSAALYIGISEQTLKVAAVAKPGGFRIVA